MSFMELETALLERRSAILRRCLNGVFKTYPSETARFMSDERDRFANPVGYSLAHGMEMLFEEVAGAMNAQRISTSLDEIIRIRAIQDFSPHDAISFVFLLRNAVLEELGIHDPVEALPEGQALRLGLLQFELRIGKVAAQAMDIYTRCREQVAELKEREKRSPHRRQPKVRGE
jgi:hypothetical protein